ncbi:follicular epithelium yolk protein subunit, partial [Serratia sp. OS31]|nr:follicular epithelium yolk protein subunit [Serratia sp. OS31]
MSIQIDIIATNDPKISGVIASGSIQEIIPDSEISTFKISSSNLESAVEKYLGQAPTDTYIKSPTPWNDLYNTYGWPQVKRVLVPVKTEVLSLNSIPIIVKTQKFTNNTEKK